MRFMILGFLFKRHLIVNYGALRGKCIDRNDLYTDGQNYRFFLLHFWIQ